MVDEFAILCPRVQAPDRVDDGPHSAAGPLRRQRVHEPLYVATPDVSKTASAERILDMQLERAPEIPDRGWLVGTSVLVQRRASLNRGEKGLDRLCDPHRARGRKHAGTERRFEICAGVASLRG
jgi:hypothetical protein